MNRLVRSISVRLAVTVAGSLLTSVAVEADTPGAFPHLEAWPSSLSLAGIPEGLGEGIEAVLENPTGMLTDATRGAAVSHASLFSGGLVRHQAAALCWARFTTDYDYSGGQVARRRGEVKSAFGLGLTNLSGDLPGNESYGELQLSLSYARPVLSGLQTGFRLRLVQARSSVDGSDGGGAAFDLGLEGSLWGWRIGGVAHALFSEIRWDRSVDTPLPRGYDISMNRTVHGRLVVMAGAALSDDAGPRRIAIGASWNLPGLPLELSMAPALRDTGEDRIAEISAGAGIETGSFLFTYGLRTGPPGLGEIHRFGLRVALH